MAPYLASFPGWAFPAYLILSFIPLVVRPSKYRYLYFLPILAISYKTLHYTTGNVTNDYGIACGLFTLLFMSSDFILITDVQNELRSVKPPQVKPASQYALSGRISWAWDLFTNVRGVGWAHEPVSVLPPRPARKYFVVKQLASLAVLGLMFDLAMWHNSFNPAYFREGPSLAGYGWLWRFECIWGWAIPGYATLAAQNCVVSLISVGLGRSDPEDWPWLFGSFLDAWSVRRFWGRTWHQVMRRFVTAHGKFLSRRVLGLATGTNLSAYVQLYTAFLISGIIHYAADYVVLRNWQGGALKFFMAQAVAITVEDGVITLGRRVGFKGTGVAWRLLGYAWVWSWFALVFPMWQDPLNRAGLIEDGANTSFLRITWEKWAEMQ
ncbi:membrane bound O-acyl transferase family-domain-containing protein [Rhodocollybia butyracea]|uniref:Membrane bound O-acyl transferase family-domain-containing protein n=1 Tax=Rhodocollybia butyracea TaxID=206335 RepID=A0A9P5UG68_9AGAR|nr:membrane bound O-acyl transferase family-domain-containing protein [Rhodocollybia butyracea]